MPGAGALDRRVTVQVPADSVSVTGEPIEVWSTLATVWAMRRDTAAAERFAAGQELATRTAVFTIRWRSGITGRARLLDGGLTWDVTGVAERGRKEFLELTVTAQGA